MIDMAGKDIIPAVIRFTTEVAQSVHAVESIGGDPEVQRELLDNVTALLKEAKAALADLRVKQSKAVELTGKEQARFYYKTVCPAMQNLRNPIDRLEMMVSGDLWPMPTYDELLFNV